MPTVSSERRRALVGLMVALVPGISGGLVTGFLSTVTYPRPVARINLWFVSGLALLTVAIVTAACTKGHRYLVRLDRKNTEVQPDAH